MATGTAHICHAFYARQTLPAALAYATFSRFSFGDGRALLPDIVGLAQIPGYLLSLSAVQVHARGLHNFLRE